MPKTFITRLKLIDDLIQKRNTGNAAALNTKGSFLVPGRVI